MIPAQPGKGKTYWVSHGLYEYLKANGFTCLFLIQRTRTKEQLKKDFTGKEDTIHIETYQSIEQRILHKKPMPQYNFIVCDEAQYFTSDISFNHYTDVSFDWIFKQHKSVKIFISATLESFKYRLMNKQRGNIFMLVNGVLQPLDIFACTPSKLTFSTPYDYSYINSLTFFHGKEQLEKIAAQVIENKRKAVFFIQAAERALELYKKFKDDMIFSCSKENTEYKKYMNEKLIDSIVDTCSFDSAILVTTAALDSGFTLKDSSVDTIVVDMLEPETVIQCVGRKRPINDADHVDLYIRGRSNAEINRSLQKMIATIKMGKLFSVDEQEYYIKNNRQNASNHLVYDEIIGNDDNNKPNYKKAVNMSDVARLEYYAYNLFPEMLKEPFGYDKYLAKHFGFFDEETKHYTYKTRSDKQQSLRDYLDSVVGIEFLTAAERKPLIEAIHVTNKNRKMLRTLDPLNGALKEMGLPHMIVTYRRNPYKCIWKVIDPTQY